MEGSEWACGGGGGGGAYITPLLLPLSETPIQSLKTEASFIAAQIRATEVERLEKLILGKQRKP